MSKKLFKKYAQGIYIVKSKNSSFNNDLSGIPRRLPDEFGTIYATDKSLKYCIRRYLIDQGEKVFVWRRCNKELKPLNIDENYKAVFDEERPKEPTKIMEKLVSALDVRLFGITYAGENMNLSLTGTTQITYGINKFPENVYYTNNILSPYLDVTSDNGKKNAKKSRSMGNESKTLESHYVYDFFINPNNLIEGLAFLKNKEKFLLTEEDIHKLKNAFCQAVNHVNSCSKIGCESELLLFVNIKSNEDGELIKSHLLPLMKDFVSITLNEEKVVIDLTNVQRILEKYGNYIENVEIYYNEDTSEIKLLEGKKGVAINKINIVDLKEIKLCQK